MKKSLYLIILSTLMALFSLMCAVPPAFASTNNITASHTKSAILIRAEKYRFHPPAWQTQNQYFHGNSYSHIRLKVKGHNQNNSGNQGHNRGYNRNFGANAGNLIISQNRARGYRRTNQYFWGNSYSQNDEYSGGYNQNNSGNQGDNQGYNEDHGSNAGNQVVN